MPVLRFDTVSKTYPGGHTALAEVSFAVDAGEMLFVTGHSGAGKSTLLKLIQLVERPSRGAVLFDDRNLLKVRSGGIAGHRRQLGVVYQNHQLLMDRSVADNVALPLVLRTRLLISTRFIPRSTNGSATFSATLRSISNWWF